MNLHEWLARALSRPVAEATGRIMPDHDGEALEAERLEGRLSALKRCASSLTLEDVHIRGMNACNDVIDYYDSRFTVRSLKEIARLFPGSAMARGHDMTSHPLARVFEGDTLLNEQGSRAKELRDLSLASWARGLFYVPKAMSHASDLITAIDTGLEREVSLHWLFDRATCSACGEDIRSCEHLPGEDYEGSRCFYEMEGITEILETSFVLKGGQRGTTLFGADHAARSMPFGRAIKELKTDRKAWDSWRKLAPSKARRETPREIPAAKWFADGLTKRIA